jgi:hypothetical protein
MKQYFVVFFISMVDVCFVVVIILPFILLRLTPERAPRTVLRYERPENLGFYACLVTTNVGSFNFVIEKLFSSVPLKVNSIQNGRLITTTIQTSTIDMKNTTKYCFILYIMMSGDVHYNPGPIRHLWSPNMHRSLGFQVFHISKQFLGLSLVLILIKFQIR